MPDMEAKHKTHHNLLGGKKGTDQQGEQEHVHEFQGSVMLAAEPGGDLHNHRFAGVSRQAKDTDCHHVHRLKTRTDFYEDHFHKIKEVTGEDIPVFDEHNQKIGHVHGASGNTTVVDKHSHEFKVATLIENPIGEIQPWRQEPEKCSGKKSHGKDNR